MVPTRSLLPVATLLALLSLLSPLSAAALLPFSQWPHQRVQLADVNIHLRYAGAGPPILLVHGFPQHSLTWHTIGPILAQNYTVIAADNRGCGESTIPRDNDYTAASGAADLQGVLDFLGINRTYVFGHDKGTGLAAALAATNRELVKRVALSEYPLPGFGYEQFWAPAKGLDLYASWQLAFFSVPDAAQFLIQGRERELLQWYFYQRSYGGNSAISYDDLNEYTRAISKFGFLRSGLTYFAVDTVLADSAFFNRSLRGNPLAMPLLGLGGEASLGTRAQQELVYGSLGTDVQLDTIPKAGHWIADENPEWVAQRVLQFLREDDGIPAVDLSYLTNRVGM